MSIEYFCQTIDVDPVDLLQNGMLTILRSKFNNKCLNGGFLLNVTEVISQGPVLINQVGKPNFCTCSVKFAAEMQRFLIGDFILCTVSTIRKEFIEGNAPNVIIYIDSLYGDRLSSGDKLFVEIKDSRARLGNNRVVITAKPYFAGAKKLEICVKVAEWSANYAKYKEIVENTLKITGSQLIVDIFSPVKGVSAPQRLSAIKAPKTEWMKIIYLPEYAFTDGVLVEEMQIGPAIHMDAANEIEILVNNFVKMREFWALASKTYVQKPQNIVQFYNKLKNN